MGRGSTGGPERWGWLPGITQGIFSFFLFLKAVLLPEMLMSGVGERPGKPIAVTPVCAQDMGTSQDTGGDPQPRTGEADGGFSKGAHT